MARDDPQAKKLYLWEDNKVLPHSQSLNDTAACKKYINYAASWLDIPIPDIILTNRNLDCWANPSKNVIRLATWGRNPAVILHEVAHLADYQYFMHDAIKNPHGPSFLGIAMDLYSHFLTIDRKELESSADMYKLRYCSSFFESPDETIQRSPYGKDADKDFMDDEF